jgi:hypothetical protein
MLLSQTQTVWYGFQVGPFGTHSSTFEFSDIFHPNSLLVFSLQVVDSGVEFSMLK